MLIFVFVSEHPHSFSKWGFSQPALGARMDVHAASEFTRTTTCPQGAEDSVSARPRSGEHWTFCPCPGGRSSRDPRVRSRSRVPSPFRPAGRLLRGGRLRTRPASDAGRTVAVRGAAGFPSGLGGHRDDPFSQGAVVGSLDLWGVQRRRPLTQCRDLVCRTPSAPGESGRDWRCARCDEPRDPRGNVPQRHRAPLERGPAASIPSGASQGDRSGCPARMPRSMDLCPRLEPPPAPIARLTSRECQPVRARQPPHGSEHALRAESCLAGHGGWGLGVDRRRGQPVLPRLRPRGRRFSVDSAAFGGRTLEVRRHPKVRPESVGSGGPGLVGLTLGVR